MIDKKELYSEIDNLVYEILDEIVCPVTDLTPGTIWADSFMADIACYTMGEEDQDEEILKRIGERYGLPSLSDEEFISPLDAGWSLASIALYILLKGEYKPFVIENANIRCLCTLEDKGNGCCVKPLDGYLVPNKNCKECKGTGFLK